MCRSYSFSPPSFPRDAFPPRNVTPFPSRYLEFFPFFPILARLFFADRSAFPFRPALPRPILFAPSCSVNQLRCLPPTELPFLPPELPIAKLQEGVEPFDITRCLLDYLPPPFKKYPSMQSCLSLPHGLPTPFSTRIRVRPTAASVLSLLRFPFATQPRQPRLVLTSPGWRLLFSYFSASQR